MYSRFFDLLGSIFGFVVKDVTDKLDILETYCESSNKENYKTVETMVKFETTNGLTSKKSNPPNGSRTLLRLHRAMEFVALFIQKTAQSEEKLSHVAYQAYHETLAKYHPWLIRKGVGLAVYTLPTRDHLLKDICSEPEEAATKLNNLQAQIELVYQTVQRIYCDYDVLNLP